MTQQLGYYQKRQATAHYYFSSLEYLKGLKTRVDALVASADPVADKAQRSGVDRFLTSKRWGARDTVSNWSTGAWPFLKSFQESCVWHIAACKRQEYGITGANQCWMGMNEYSMLWATAEEESSFKERLNAVCDYASTIDSICSRPWSDVNESMMNNGWQNNKQLFPRLPRFIVRTDVVGKSGQLPPQTGVYVPQNDCFSVCQFAWTGNKEGYLDEANTLNPLGREIVQQIGHKSLWAKDGKLLSLLKTPKYSAAFKKYFNARTSIFAKPEDIDDPVQGSIFAEHFCTTQAPADWYYVEQIEGEYDDDPDADTIMESASDAGRSRVESAKPCPRTGWWMTPAKAGSRRYFQQDEIMPTIGSDYGLTIWQLDVDQSTPKL